MPSSSLTATAGAAAAPPDPPARSTTPLAGLRIAVSGMVGEYRAATDALARRFGATLAPTVSKSALPDVLVTTSVLAPKYKVRERRGGWRWWDACGGMCGRTEGSGAGLFFFFLPAARAAKEKEKNTLDPSTPLSPSPPFSLSLSLPHSRSN